MDPKCSYVKLARLPSIDELMGSVLNIEQAFSEDPIIGRKHLHALFRDGRLDLTIDGDTYVAKGPCFPLMA